MKTFSSILAGLRKLVEAQNLLKHASESYINCYNSRIYATDFDEWEIFPFEVGGVLIVKRSLESITIDKERITFVIDDQFSKILPELQKIGLIYGKYNSKID